MVFLAFCLAMALTLDKNDHPWMTLGTWILFFLSLNP